MITVSTSSAQEARAAFGVLCTLPPTVQWKVYLLGREYAPEKEHQHLPDLGPPHPANRPERGQ